METVHNPSQCLPLCFSWTDWGLLQQTYRGEKNNSSTGVGKLSHSLQHSRARSLLLGVYHPQNVFCCHNKVRYADGTQENNSRVPVSSVSWRFHETLDTGTREFSSVSQTMDTGFTKPCVLLCLLDPTVRKTRNERPQVALGPSTLRFYYFSISPSAFHLVSWDDLL